MEVSGTRHPTRPGRVLPPRLSLHSQSVHARLSSLGDALHFSHSSSCHPSFLVFLCPFYSTSNALSTILCHLSPSYQHHYLMSSDEIFFVQAILAKSLDRAPHRTLESHYLVRWEGFGPSEDTWEPRSSLLVGASESVLEFDRISELLESSLPSNLTGSNAVHSPRHEGTSSSARIPRSLWSSHRRYPPLAFVSEDVANGA